MKKLFYGLGAVAAVVTPVVAVVSCGDKNFAPTKETNKLAEERPVLNETQKFESALQVVEKYVDENKLQDAFAIHLNLSVLIDQGIDLYFTKNADDTWHMSMGGNSIKDAFGFFSVNMSTMSDDELKTASKDEINNHREDTIKNWFAKMDKLIANASKMFSTIFTEDDSFELEASKMGEVVKTVTIL